MYLSNLWKDCTLAQSSRLLIRINYKLKFKQRNKDLCTSLKLMYLHHRPSVVRSIPQIYILYSNYIPGTSIRTGVKKKGALSHSHCTLVELHAKTLRALSPFTNDLKHPLSQLPCSFHYHYHYKLVWRYLYRMSLPPESSALSPAIYSFYKISVDSQNLHTTVELVSFAVPRALVFIR